MMWTLCGIEPTRFVGSILVVSVCAGEVAYGPRVLQVVDALGGRKTRSSKVQIDVIQYTDAAARRSRSSADDRF